MVPKTKKDLPEADPEAEAEAETDYPIRKRARVYTDLSEPSEVSESSEDDITVFTDEVDIPFLLNKYNTWRPYAFSRALASAFQSRIGQKIPVSKWRYINIAIFRRLYVDKTLFTTAYQGEHLDPVSNDENDLVIHAH